MSVHELGAGSVAKPTAPLTFSWEITNHMGATRAQARLPGTPGYVVTTRSRVTDEAREAELYRALVAAEKQLEAARDAIDAYEDEKSADAEEQANQLSVDEELR